MARIARPWYRKGRGWYLTRGDTQVRLAGADASIDEAWEALRRIMAGREVAAAYTLGDALADRLRHQEACFRSGSLASDRIKYLRRVYREATEALGAVPLADLTPARLLDWLSSRPTWSNTTRNVAGGMVRAAVRAAVRAGKASRDPLDGLRLPRQSRREAIPTDGEILAARDAWRDQAWRDLVDLLRLTGARPGELASLTAAEIDREAKLARLKRHKNAHHGKARSILFPPEAWSIVERLMAENPTGPLLRNTEGTAWNRVTWRRRLSRRGFAWSLYGIRHRAHIRLIEAGVDPRTVADLLGNSPAVVMAVYMHASPDRLRSAAERLGA